MSRAQFWRPVARIRRGVLLDRESNLLAFGAILRHAIWRSLHPENI